MPHGRLKAPYRGLRPETTDRLLRRNVVWVLDTHETSRRARRVFIVDAEGGSLCHQARSAWRTGRSRNHGCRPPPRVPHCKAMALSTLQSLRNARRGSQTSMEATVVLLWTKLWPQKRDTRPAPTCAASLLRRRMPPRCPHCHHLVDQMMDQSV